MSRKIPEVFLVLCAFLTGALAVTEIGLAIKAFQILNQRKKLVTSQLPGGKLSAEPILQSLFDLLIRSKRWISVSFGVAAFVCLPALIAETVIGELGA
ncbi:hypothetical protein DFH28DRAFT_1118149 [Melampsora americana]|nr:hypothetical protein DFH28DRAFT_1118149 [Melampsora americana]